MDNDNPDQQKLAAQKGNRIKGVISQPGWQDILSILEKEWDAAYTNLRTGQTPAEKQEGDITLNIIEDLLKKIDRNINFGEKQANRLRSKALGKLPDGRPLI